MIGTLQKRFVITAMTAITVLILVIVLATGGLYTYNVYRNVRWMAEMLTDNDGLPQPGEDGVMEHGGGKFPKGEGKRRLTVDNALSYRFFLVRFDEEGGISSTDVSRIYSVTEDEAAAMAQEAAEGGSTSGIKERFFYYIKEKDGGRTAVFIDVSAQTASIVNLFVISLAIAAVCWLLMLLLVAALSRRTIAPIADNMKRQRQFVTNAGHELKTPLAIILANTEALELYNGQSKWTANIKAQTVRLSELMQNLLTLSKMDEADVNLPMEQIDIADLIDMAESDYEEPARGKNIEIVCNVPHLDVCGNRGSLIQLFGILFDNAVKYTPEGGKISVTAYRDGRSVVLEQSNSIDPGQAAEDPGIYFDRFYRQDSSRTQKGGGYGIGLSAAKAIAAANRADLSVRYKDEDTIVFKVKMMV